MCCVQFHLQDYHLLWCRFPDDFGYLLADHDKGPTTPPRQVGMVWALSVSLVATQEISIDVFSSRYLDISVPWVLFILPIGFNKR